MSGDKNISIIIRPLITEKAIAANEAGKYAFVVRKSATKNEVRKTIESLYGVKVAQVNIINKPAKIKRFRNIKGKQSGYKKAIVTLKKGEKIPDIYKIKH